MNQKRLRWIGACLLIAAQAVLAEAPEGLLLRLKVGDREAASVVPGVNLYAPAGSPVSPLLPPGGFSAEWSGHVNADLRGDYRFKVAARGVVKVELNGKVVLEGEGGIGPSEEIRLNKGANPLRVTFRSPEKGDGFVRLLWSEYGFLWEPIDPVYLTRETEAPGLAKAEKVLRGRELFLNRRCVKCHALEGESGVPELAMDAPSFGGIGSRRNVAWMASWIENPQAERADARMPRLLHGKTAADDAKAIAAYLGSLKDDSEGVIGETKEDGGQWIADLHCVGCHRLPGEAAEEGKISLGHVNEKFLEGRLAEFLLNPTKHYQWRRMPDFMLESAEAIAMAKHLRATATSVTKVEVKGDVAKGRELVKSVGCLACHELPGVENGREAKSLTGLKAEGGCLADDGLAPRFGFAKEDREALQAFLGTDRASLKRHVPTEFAARHSRELNCRACHGALEGFPPYERLGGKLKPEFMKELISGEFDDISRPWLPRVMPKFPVIADSMATGLAHSHGYPEKTATEPAIDGGLAKIGRKLVGVDGGFSCISCHGVGDLQPTQVFEAEGINLALPARRLQKDYFIRWLLNPLKIEPQTKMPVYFDEEGNSPLFDVLDGKGMKQLEAFWQYMRAGDAIKPPELPSF